MQAKLDLNPDSSESCFCDTESGTIEPFVQIRFFYLQAPACVIHKKLNKQRKGGI